MLNSCYWIHFRYLRKQARSSTSASLMYIINMYTHIIYKCIINVFVCRHLCIYTRYVIPTYVMFGWKCHIYVLIIKTYIWHFQANDCLSDHCFHCFFSFLESIMLFIMIKLSLKNKSFRDNISLSTCSLRWAKKLFETNK